MKQMKVYLLNEMKTLRQEIDELKKKLRSYPPGSVRVSHCKGTTQFYYVAPASDSARTSAKSAITVCEGKITNAGHKGESANAGHKGESANAGHKGESANAGHKGESANAEHKGESANTGHEKGKTKGRSKGSNKVRYIRKENMDLVRKLIQKDYDSKLLKILEKRYNAIEKACAVYESNDAERLFLRCCSGRRAIIVSEHLPDEEYARRWQEMPYEGKKIIPGTVPEIVTVRGEHVRSKSEKILADSFERMGVPYRYEFPLEYQGERIIFPDFVVLNKRTRKEYYLEHLGKMDDPEYARYALRRIEEMEMHGIFPGRDLLLTFETSERPLSQKMINGLIREYLL